MKYLATVTALAWTAAAAPSLRGRSPALGDSMKPGITVFSDASAHAKRAPAPRLGDSLDAGLTVVSHGAAPAAVKERKRATVESDCSSSGKQHLVDQSLADCVSRARAGAKAAQDTNSHLIMTFFKNDSPDIRAKIAADFDKMASECQGRFDSSNTTVTCAQDQNQCQPGTSAVTTSYGRPDDQVASNLPKPEIRLCDQFFGLNPDSAGNAKAKSAVFGRQSGSQPACGSLDSPGVMLHEMSHAVIGTTDMIKANGEGSYGLADVASLSPEQNLKHADTYALFAHAAALGCSQDDLRSGRTPKAGVPTSLYGNDGTSSDTQSDPTTPQQGTGGSDGRGPRRNTTTPPPKTRTRGPTMGTRGPGPRIPQEQPPQNASPEETQPPSQDTQDPAQETQVPEGNAVSQPDSEAPAQETQVPEGNAVSQPDSEDPAQETQVLAEGNAVSQPDSQDPAQETQVLAEGNAVSQPDIQDPTQETQVLAEGNAVSQPEAASAPAPSAEQSEPLDPYSSSALEQGGRDFYRRHGAELQLEDIPPFR